MAKRNNKNRIGPTTAQKVQGMVPPSMSVEPSFAIPTEFVELPSRGRLYPEGHPFRDKEEVEINFMTAKDEDILANKTLLRKGILLDRFINNILVDKRVNPQDLFSGDRSAILIAARVTGYGPEYRTVIKCPSCGESSEYEFDVSDYEVNYADNYEEHGLTATPNGSYTLEAPRSKVALEIRLLDGKTEKYLTDTTRSKQKNNILETPLTDLLKMVIVSVNGNPDRRYIESYVDSMPAYDSRYVRKVYNEINPSIDLTQDFECPKCGVTTPLEVPLNADFFWPKL